MFRALIFAVFLAMVAGWGVSAFAEDSESDRIRAYYDALSQHFTVSQETLSDLRDKGIVLEELPVVLMVANRAKKNPSEVGAIRAGGESWMKIAETYGLGADVFYIMINAKFSSETYSPILEKFKTVQQSQISKVLLTDGEIVNLANLKFISSVHDYTMFEIMAMRDYGKEFPQINEQVKEAKDAMLKREKEERKKKKKENKTE